MKFSHFLLSNSNKTSNNPDSELARPMNKGDGEGTLPTNVCSRRGSDSLFDTEHWQLQGDSQYSALIVYMDIVIISASKSR